MKAELLQSDNRFQMLAEKIRPDAPFPDIRDAEFFVRHDGLIVNAEGWSHPTPYLVGEVLYAPDVKGNKEIFGQKYRKVSLYPGTYTPVPYAQRTEVLREYDPELVDSQAGNPYFARYKQLFPRADFIAHLPAKQTLHKVLTEMAMPGDEILADLEDAERLLGINMSQLSIGLTGAPLLGNIRGYHDLDLVFQGTVEENIAIAKTMRDLVKYEPHRRLTEGGKGWNIRFFNDRQKLMCNFFTYKYAEDAPLVQFEMDVIEDGVTVEGTVSDDLHTVYTPSILGLKDVRFTQLSNQPVNERYNDLPVVIYHTATRGECFEEDMITATGALVQITTPQDSYEAICVIEREGVRNLTPTWDGYYED